MGYVKNEWNTGDVVTAAKLNNIEDGIDKAIEKPDTGNVNDVLTKTENGVKWAPASGGDTEILVVTGEINEDDTLSNVSHTYEQIKAAYESGKVVVFRSGHSDYQLFSICDGDRPSECLVFFISSLDPNKDAVARIEICQDTSRSIFEYFDKNMVPDYHSSQEIGKYLRVNSFNGLEWAPASGGVESVNGKTGTVVLNSNDINDGDDTIHNVLGGKADLVSGKVPASQLPSYVDDVLEYNNLAAFPQTGETGKIYVAIDTNFTYRWSGSSYIKIGSGAEKFVVTITNSEDDIVTLDKTAKEIYDANAAGKIVIIKDTQLTLFECDKIEYTTGGTKYYIGFSLLKVFGNDTILTEGIREQECSEDNKDFHYYEAESYAVPSFLSGDSGKVLTACYDPGRSEQYYVEWKTTSGSSEVLVVTGEMNEDGTLSNISHTYEQIKAAYESGKVIVFEDNKDSDVVTPYPLVKLIYDESKPSDNQACFSVIDREVTYYIDIHQNASDNHWYEEDYAQLPYCAESEKVGQVLTVKSRDGLIYPDWMDAPTELPSGGTAGQVLTKTTSGTAWENSSGGLEVFYVEFSDGEEESKVISNKTAKEIYDANAAGKVVIGKCFNRLFYINECDSNTMMTVGYTIEFFYTDHNYSMFIAINNKPENTTEFDYSESDKVAEQIYYNNEESGLESEDVQGAIDELAARPEGAVPLTDAEMIQLLSDLDVLPAVYETEGTTKYIYADENNNVLLW